MPVRQSTPQIDNLLTKFTLDSKFQTQLLHVNVFENEFEMNNNPCLRKANYVGPCFPQT